MSKYECMETGIVDRDCLIASLCENGFSQNAIEVYPELTNLVGYEGRIRREKAEVVIRRRHIGAASNDLGFVRENGRYKAVISDYDRARFNDQWLKNVVADHDKHRVLRGLKAKGYSDIAVEQQIEGGRKKYRITASIPEHKTRQKAKIGLKG